MVEKTPNHSLNKYSQGDTNWTHAPDMETIEQRLVVRAPESQRGEYDSYEGAIFLATDTGTLFVGDGQSWNPLPIATGDRQRRIWVSDDGSTPSNASTDDIVLTRAEK